MFSDSPTSSVPIPIHGGINSDTGAYCPTSKHIVQAIEMPRFLCGNTRGARNAMADCLYTRRDATSPYLN